jgi:hypothetical protein
MTKEQRRRGLGIVAGSGPPIIFSVFIRENPRTQSAYEVRGPLLLLSSAFVLLARRPIAEGRFEQSALQ